MPDSRRNQRSTPSRQPYYVSEHSSSRLSASGRTRSQAPDLLELHPAPTQVRADAGYGQAYSSIHATTLRNADHVFHGGHTGYTHNTLPAVYSAVGHLQTNNAGGFHYYSTPGQFGDLANSNPLSNISTHTHHLSADVATHHHHNRNHNPLPARGWQHDQQIHSACTDGYSMGTVYNPLPTIEETAAANAADPLQFDGMDLWTPHPSNIHNQPHHIKSHDNVKGFPCVIPGCLLAFNTAGNRRSHERRFHKMPKRGEFPN
ncbi:hypothetical protein EV715DRAFT_292768 [Schizophyllum commune]